MDRPPLRAVSALLAGALLLGGCTSKITRDTTLSDREIAVAGEEFMARKDFREAADRFRVLLEKYPASPLAERSQKLLAEASEAAGDDVAAEEAWNDFLRLHPGSADVPYVLYRKGSLVARLAPPPGRDPARTREALAVLLRVPREYPASPWAEKAAGKAAELRSRLAEQEAVVAEFYLVRKNFAAAAVRAERAAREYADTPLLPRLLFDLARARAGEGRRDDALAILKTLRERFPSYEGDLK